MDKLDMALELINSAKEEDKNLQRYKQAERDYNFNKGNDNFLYMFLTTPTKQSVKDKIKMARKYLMEAYKEY